jgi:hypothetical protein
MSYARGAALQVDTQPAEEMPDWLREEKWSSLLWKPQRPVKRAIDDLARAASLEPEATAEEEGAPDWLKGTAGAARRLWRQEEENPPVRLPAEACHRLLAALRRPRRCWTPSKRGGRSAGMDARRIRCRAGSDRRPGPMTEVPDRLREARVADQPPPGRGRNSNSRANPAALPAEAQPPAQPEEGVPDWLKERLAAAAAHLRKSSSRRTLPWSSLPLTGWRLASGRPALDAEQAWRKKCRNDARKSGVAPEVGGPAAYDQEVPDWLREADVWQLNLPPGRGRNS